jgi:serine/threonine protein phosphatase PrpC
MKQMARPTHTRPLARAPVASFNGSDEGGGSAYLAVGALTDRGRTKDRNQDSLFVLNGALSQEDDLLPLGLYIVADGMGDGEAGTQASALTVRLVASRVLDRIYRPLLLEAEQTSDRQPIHQVLREAVIVANRRVQQMCTEGRTTCTCALVLGMNVFVAHVGDSRAYLVDQDTIDVLTTDHSLVNRLIELGQITPEEAKTHPQRNVLYRAVGRGDNLEVDTGLQSLSVGNSLLLCSDGLWGTLSPEIITLIVRTAPSPQVACRRLVARANESGGQDNITVVLVQVRD